MQDRNGKELLCGDIVRISGAYFGVDNALYFVEQDGHNPANGATVDCITLLKVGKTGKVSAGKYKVAFWPLTNFVNSREKRAEAEAWNREHATIEKVETVDNSDVLAYLEAEAKKDRENAEGWRRRGYGPAWYEASEAAAAYFESAIARLKGPAKILEA